MMSCVSFGWSRVQGDMNDIHNPKLVTSTAFSKEVWFNYFPGITYADLFQHVLDFDFGVYSIVFAGNRIPWSTPIPESVLGSKVNFVARIGHWSNESYQKNDPIVLFKD